MVDEGRRRVVVAHVRPDVEGGRFPAKGIVGRPVRVEADLLADGHDLVTGVLEWQGPDAEGWQAVPLVEDGDDRWHAEFVPDRIGRWRFRIVGWVDRFGTFRRDWAARREAGQLTEADRAAGVALLTDLARGSDDAAAAEALRHWARTLAAAEGLEAASAVVFADELAQAVRRGDPRRFATVLDPPREVVVDPEIALVGAWYEMFPRSASPDPGRPGTLADVVARLDYVAGMGFDVLYLPPIHPIGHTRRKGRNDAPEAGPEDPGSPWAVGSEAGGHDAVDPRLGTLEDFDRLVREAAARGIRVAMDLAFQCSPDHPYVRTHPEWFRHRPDGSIRHAENPPKQYEDIYPLDFETPAWPALWQELKRVVEFWIARGIRIFRVDNPHTKPFPFWEWLIGEIKRRHPDVIFLAEAFTRPKVMYRLAQLGFSQSYTYFTWRHDAREIADYVRELTSPPVVDFFRPNFWPNTPDILARDLREGGRPAFIGRLVLAATLSASYGIYGPAFELMERQPREPGSEEYQDSEKYTVRHWDIGRADSLAPLVARINAIRRENPALADNTSVVFHPLDNPAFIAYSKHDATRSNIILVVVNLDWHRTQAGWVDVQLEAWGWPDDRRYTVHDLLTGARYAWQGRHNYVELNPDRLPAHVFRVEP
ncbi:MAG: alpha-1,4-glucan--maltose-1-phosphate maltosyltransferase [Actinomycetia bacterium]|nr:alpha-1,4-glucan--maltose-1-phosphate maltosyltransferase [Actinomycetes bacterium]